MALPEHIVVVGAGLAGLRTVEELRAAQYSGSITLIGAETRPPYDRPPLSKKVMAGDLDDTSLRADMDALSVRLRLGESAAVLDDGLVRSDTAEYRWEALIVATGASPVRLPGSGPQRVLRTADDALALRELLRPGLRLVIVGAGWIGAELATAAANRGCQVTVLEAAGAPVAAAVGAEVGARTAPWYDAAGVELRLRTAVASIEPDGVALGDGGWLDADVVVTAVGVRPDVSWLAGSGVEVDNGVVVDGQLQSSVPGVYAVGDCSSFWSARYGRQLRFEHWDVALHAPAVAAANVLAGRETYDPVPYFWSEQFGRMLQYVGWHGAASRLVWRGDPAAGKWAVAWLDGSRLVAMLTVGLPRDLGQARRLIQAGSSVDADRLADPGVPVRDAAVG
ncbi:MAG TPA: FAD-dependent oxidoreductase [Streptosporangiaceae bacterium]|jgi:3-phenylpropionate/trans-cinnamate dioxygenase ferredoxin reductase subunit